jgi:hypothetical protein
MLTCPTCGGPPRFTEGLQSPRVVCAVCGGSFCYTPESEFDPPPRLDFCLGLLGAPLLCAGVLGTLLGLWDIAIELARVGMLRLQGVWFVLLASTLGMAGIGTVLVRLADDPGRAARGSGTLLAELAVCSFLVLGGALGAAVVLDHLPPIGVDR